MERLTLYHQEVLALHRVSTDTLVVTGVRVGGGSEWGWRGVGGVGAAQAAVLLPGEVDAPDSASTDTVGGGELPCYRCV